MMTYFAVDGSYGDGEDIVVVDTVYFTDDDWDDIEGTISQDRPAKALEIKAKYDNYVM